MSNSDSFLSPYALCDHLSTKKSVVRNNLALFKKALGDWFGLTDEERDELKSLPELDVYVVVAISGSFFQFVHLYNFNKKPPVIMDINALEYDTWVSIPRG